METSGELPAQEPKENKVTSEEPRLRGGRLIRRIGSFFKRESTPESSRKLLVDKLTERVARGKAADLLVTDVDGTVYVNQADHSYIGKNEETSKQIKEKKLPLLLNTAKPTWDIHEDARFAYNIKLPVPDVVMAGDGTMIFWRQRNGSLAVDQEYADRMKEHPITIRNDGEAPITTHFNPQLVMDGMKPLLDDYRHSGVLRESLIDKGPVLPDGTAGLEGLRLVVKDMSYNDIKKLSRDLREYISGVKLQMAEMTDQTNAEQFSGWLHIIPSNAGKNEALSYVLSRIKEDMPDDLHAHVLGDTSVDIPMLAMGSDPQRDGYTVHQYAVGNMPERTSTKLSRVIKSLANPRARGQKRAHLTMLSQPGPDALHHVVNSLA